MNCSPPGSSVHGIFQAIVLEWIAISFSRGSSRPRDRTRVSCIVDRCFTVWATREVILYGCNSQHPQNNDNSNTKDHWSQIIITNMVKMKQLEILWKLPKCDTETQSEQILLEKGYWQTCPIQGCHRPSICKEHSLRKVQYNEMYLYSDYRQQNCTIKKILIVPSTRKRKGRDCETAREMQRQ